MTKTLQEKISDLTEQGWEYQDDFRLHVKDNTFVQLIALVKDDQYRAIKNGKISSAKSF